MSQKFRRKVTSRPCLCIGDGTCKPIQQSPGNKLQPSSPPLAPLETRNSLLCNLSWQNPLNRIEEAARVGRHAGRKEGHERPRAYQYSYQQKELRRNPSEINFVYLLHIWTDRLKSICALLKQVVSQSLRLTQLHYGSISGPTAQGRLPYETPDVILPFPPARQVTGLSPLDPKSRYSRTQVLKRRSSYRAPSFTQIQWQDDGYFYFHFNKKLAQSTVPVDKWLLPCIKQKPYLVKLRKE